MRSNGAKAGNKTKFYYAQSNVLFFLFLPMTATN
jgi:hypothetical protein